MIRGIILLLATLVAFTGCRKKSRGASGPGTEASPQAPTGPGLAGGEPAYTAPPPPPTPTPPAVEAARFNAPQPMNMYAPVYPGDYQAQLDVYNRVLRKWLIDSSNAPRNFQEIMGTFNSPKPPQPPAGRRLVYDPKTKTVSLQ